MEVNMMAQIEEIIKKAESEFTEPAYVEYKVRYVENKEYADVCVSKNHTLKDYLVMGAVALSKAVKNETGEILVYNLEKENKETFQVIQGGHRKDAKMNSELLLQVHEPVDEIFKSLYKGELKVSGLGLAMMMSMAAHFSEVNPFSDEITSELKFKNFDDVKTAEENIFFLIKKFYGATIRGWHHEMLGDCK